MYKTHQQDRINVFLIIYSSDKLKLRVQLFLKRQAITSICDDIVHSLDELNRRAKLNPPVVLFSLQPVCIETGHVLHCRQERWWVCLKMRNI